MKIIDFCGYVAHPASLNYVMKNVIGQEGYLDTFGPSLSKQLNIKSSLLNEISEKKYKNITEMTNEGMKQFDTSHSIKKLEKVGVKHTVVFCNTTHDVILLSEWGDFIKPFIDINESNYENLDEIELLANKGLLNGVIVAPFISEMKADDQRYYKLYDICQKLNLPVWIHTSANLKTKVSIYLGHPSNLERVAIDFPDLKIIAGHGGWPWLNDMIAIASKYKNVYIDISAHRPLYMKKAGSGWESLLNYGDNLLRNKVIFGSTWYLMPVSFEKLIEEILDLPISEETKECWLYKNAAGILNIEK